MDKNLKIWKVEIISVWVTRQVTTFATNVCASLRPFSSLLHFNRPNGHISPSEVELLNQLCICTKQIKDLNKIFQATWVLQDGKQCYVAWFFFLLSKSSPCSKPTINDLINRKGGDKTSLNGQILKELNINL